MFVDPRFRSACGASVITTGQELKAIAVPVFETSILMCPTVRWITIYGPKELITACFYTFLTIAPRLRQT
jgi:hypothetical protein